MGFLYKKYFKAVETAERKFIMTEIGKKIDDYYEASFNSMKQLKDCIEASVLTTERIEVNKPSDYVVKEIGGEINAHFVDVEGIDKEVLISTTKSTDLYISCMDFNAALRDCSIPSLLNAAKISGTALGKLPIETFAKVVNACNKVVDGKYIIFKRDGKVSAILSDSYVVMPQIELIEIVEKALNERFGLCEFNSGVYSHSLTVAEWKLPSNAHLTEKYIDAIGVSAVRNLNDYIPVIRFFTSDNGNAAATLLPLFKSPNGGYIRICDSMRVEHKGKDNMEKFTYNANNMYAKYVNFSDKIAEMANVWMFHPLKAAEKIAKKVGIPHKFLRNVFEEISLFGEDESMTMHDLYLLISDCIPFAMKEYRLNALRILTLEENIAKILNLNWKEYDVNK